MRARELSELEASLAGCAFCGGPGKLAPMPNTASWWRVRCQDYHCGGTTWAMDEPQKAVQAWNRRPAGGAQ